jgi:hypothetical protein
MSVRFNAETDRLTRTTGLPSVTSVTGRCFGRLNADRNDFNTFIQMVHTGNTDYQLLQTDASGTDLYLYDSQPGTGGVSLTQLGPVVLTPGNWYYMAYSNNGTTDKLYVRNVTTNGAMQTFSGAAQGARTMEYLGVGGHDLAIFEFLDGNVCGVAYWNVALTDAEVLLDSYCITPRRTANLNCFYPMFNIADKLVDYSGNGNHLTEPSSGPWATESNPPVPFRGSKTQPLINNDGVGLPETVANAEAATASAGLKAPLPYMFQYP